MIGMRKERPRQLELLAPAADRATAEEAILHGADAVYIGGPSHGARSKAANSLEDIEALVDFAHQFRAKVYVTVNTIVYEHEIRDVERMIRELYRAGVDALIVQDMGILRMDIPPIPLHASTQCDTRSVAKARFLEEVGFSQIVLARELTLEEIGEVCRSVKVPVEVFVHGALCVSYSGRCAASWKCLGRSANRGECAQMCRMPYTLRNGRGEVLMRDKYLLSLRDLNLSDRLSELVEAGVSSFKIEGRMKDAGYVRNVTAFYRKELDRIISLSPEKYIRSSLGSSEPGFTPDLAKSFNRGFTHYFNEERRPGVMASILTPKSLGEEIRDVSQLNSGDGISYFDERGEYVGVGVNGVEGKRIIGSRPFRLPDRAVIHRTFDRKFARELERGKVERKIKVDIKLDDAGVTASDERGCRVRIPLDIPRDRSKKEMDYSGLFGKLGSTIYRLGNFLSHLDSSVFLPASGVTALRRRLIEELDRANLATYPLELRRRENREYPYISRTLDSRDNVANSYAERFYREHQVVDIKEANELRRGNFSDNVLMTTRYCLRRELGCCLRDCRDKKKMERFAPPLTISTGPHVFMLGFDCARCEMTVESAGKESPGKGRG